MGEFDHAALRERLGDDDLLLGEIVGLFIDECPRNMQALRDAVVRQRPDEVMQNAHRLKGALLSIGADPAAAFALALEQQGKHGELEGAARALADLEAALVRLNAELRALPPVAP